MVLVIFVKKFDRDRTRTCNPQIRSLVPYPLGHTTRDSYNRTECGVTERVERGLASEGAIAQQETLHSKQKRDGILRILSCRNLLE